MPNTTPNAGPFDVLRASEHERGNGDGATSWIEKTPGVCGGSACIRSTRITVWGLVEWKRLGFSDERILQSISGLRPDDLAAAWNYYSANQAEIDAEIKQNEEA